MPRSLSSSRQVIEGAEDTSHPGVSSVPLTALRSASIPRSCPGRSRAGSGFADPLQEARTTVRGRTTKDHRSPNHISKIVPPTVHFRPTKLNSSFRSLGS